MSGRPVRHRLRRALLRVGVLALVLGALLWVAATTGLGMGLVIPWAMSRAAPEGWSLRVGSAEGNWLRRVHLHDLTMEGPDASVRVAEIALEYRLLPLLRRTLDVRLLHLVSPVFHGALASDDAEAAASSEDAGGRSALDRMLAGSPLGAWTLRLPDVRVDDAHAVLAAAAGPYRIERLDLAGSTLLSPDTTRVAVDSLAADVTPPPDSSAASAPDASEGASDPTRDRTARMHVAALLENGLLQVRSLRLQSPRSHVQGAGSLLLGDSPAYVDSVDFALDADPLDLRDLPLALPPSLAADPLVTMHLTAGGPPDHVRVALDANGPGSTSLRADGVMRARSAGDSAALRLDARLSADLAEWVASPYAGQLGADVALELAELDPASRLRTTGTLVHDPPESAPADILGDVTRMDLDVTRTSAARRPRPDRERTEADTAGSLLEASITLYRPAGGPSASLPGERGWLETGVVAARMEGQRSTWQLDLRLDSSSVEGSGAISWSEGSRELVVDELRARALDLSRLAVDLPSTSIDARVDGRVAGSSIESLVGRLAMRVDSSYLAETYVDTLSVTADFEDGSVTGSSLLVSDAGHLEADYRLVLEDSVVHATVTRLEGAAPVDSLAPTDSVPPVPAWTVGGRAEGTWRLGETRRGTLTATLDTSSVGGLRLTGAELEGEIMGDSVTASLRADLAAVLAAPVAITATAAGRGTTLDDATGFLAVQATRFRIQADSTRSGSADSVAVQISATVPGNLVLDGRILPAEGGRVNLSGNADVLEDALSFAFAARGTLEVPTELLSGGDIERISLESSGSRTAAGWRQASAELLLIDGHWRGVIADTLRTNVRYDSTGVALDTLSLDANVLTLAGSGTLPASAADSGTIALSAHFDLEPMRPHTEAELPTIGGNELSATIGGTTDSIEVSMSSSMTALVHRDVRVSGFEAEASALLRAPFSDLAGLVSGRARVQLDRISLPDAEIGNLTVETDGTPDSLRLEANAIVDGSRSGELGARVDPTPDGRSMEIDRLQLQLDQDEWQLLQPAVLSFRDGFALREFELRAGDQAISVDGGVTSDGALDLAVTMDSTDVGTVADLIGFPRLDGWLGGRVQLTGTTTAPVGDIDLVAGFHEESESPTSAHIVLSSDGLHVDTDVTLRDPEGGVLTVGGIVPLAGGENVDLTIDASAFSVASGVAFVDAERIAELQGRIDARLVASGPRDDPRFDGPLTLSRGLARVTPLGVTWEDIRVAARGDGTVLRIDSATVESGSGSMRLAGSVAVDTTVTLDLDAAFDDFQAIQTNVYQASISGDLHAEGTPLAPVIEGDVTTESLDVYIDERPGDAGLEDVELTAADMEILRERFGYIVVEEDVQPAPSELLTADVTVEFGRDSWIRSRSTPEMAVAFTGDVEVELRPGEEPRLDGTLTTIAERGYIAQFGKRFSPREGTVTLDGPPASAELDLSASYTVPSHANPDGAEATIVLGVTGTRDELSLSLSSEPPMENADIVSYIATGRPAASTFALDETTGGDDAAGDDGGGGGLAEAGAGIAVGQILSSIEAAAQTGVGLDVVEIRRDGIRGATLAAGKYLSPRLYLGLARRIGRRERDPFSVEDDNGSEIEIEFLAIKNLLLNLEGSASSLNVFLRGRLVY
ncbi:MAG: translocation/assembly module TamB domain-containing protein [Gemmatimonadales bacterium]